MANGDGMLKAMGLNDKGSLLLCLLPWLDECEDG